MTDSEIAAVVGAVKAVLGEQGTALRAQIAELRADLAYEKALAVEYRRQWGEGHQRMLMQLANAVGDAVKPSLQQLQRRTLALEQRAMPTEAAQ